MPEKSPGFLDDDESSALADPVYLDNLRQQMLKFATLQLSDSHLAEDTVQEALVGALKNVRSFGGRAALKTWVFAILKNKIADSLRRRKRRADTNRLLQQNEESSHPDEFFNKKGFWQPHERPTSWGDPEAAMHNQHFWQVFEACLEHLPGNQARIFMMREIIEMDSPEICEIAGISVSNLNVTLYRARIRLRKCLEKNWFSAGARS